MIVMQTTSPKGFLLIELAAALLVITLISGLLAFWQANLTTTCQNIKKRTQALFLATSLIEEYKAFKTIPLKKRDSFAIRFDVEPAQNLPSFVYVTVFIDWELHTIPHKLCIKSGVLV